MGKRAGRRRQGDARLRVLPGGGEQPKRGTTMPGDGMQPLVVELRRRLRDDDPWQLLAYLSTLVEVTDATSPGAGAGPDGEALSIGALVETFIGVDLAETTAALSVLAVLVDDEHLVADIEAELSHRRQPMPLWLRGLRETRVTGASLMSAVGDRGVNVVLGLSWAGGGGGAFLVYVDHLLGTVVRDAFPAPESIEDVLHRLEDASTSGHAPPGGLIASDLELPHARSLVEAALDNSDDTSVDPGSDTWPAGRPILDWLLRTMPEGGAGWDALDGPAGAAARGDLGDLGDEALMASTVDELVDDLLDRRGDIVDAFAQSAQAQLVGLDLDGSETDRAALGLVVGTGPDQSDDAFLRWTGHRVKDLLFGTLTRSVLVDDGIAERIPPVLHALTSWCLGRADAPQAEHVAVRDAIDDCAPAFLAIVTSFEAHRLRLAVKAYGDLLGDPLAVIPVVETSDEFDWTAFAIDRAASEVGGRDALDALVGDPLPDEDFAWSVVPSDITDPVAETLTLLDALAEERFDVEFRTACRRFLAAVAAGQPDVFRRRGKPASAAAVVAWLVGRANGIVGRGGDGMPAGDLWAHFGVSPGSSSRGQTFRKAVGLDAYAVGDSLEHAEWLTGAARQRLIARRDDALSQRAMLR